MSFREYLESRKREDSPEGDFSRDAFRDFRFPWGKTNGVKTGRDSIMTYLSIRGACREAKVAFIRLWKDYVKSGKGE